METLVQMCLQGSAMIAVVLVLRVALHNRLPKAAFLVLWGVVLARLLLPVSIPVPFNAWSLVAPDVQTADVVPSAVEASEKDALAADDPDTEASASSQTDAALEAAAEPTAAEGAATAPGTVGAAADPDAAPGTSAASDPHRMVGLVWLVGSAASLAALAGLYAYHIRRLSDAVELYSRATRQWLSAHPLRRRLRIKESARIASPMTRGVLRPTILVPPGFDWEDPSKSALVLEHEFVHVARFDIIYKALLAAAACLFWFNPLVWALYVCANHDIELACDETVARRLNGHGRSLYAHALLDMVERRQNLTARSGLLAGDPLAAGFSRSAVEKRVAALGHIRPIGLAASLATVVLAAAITAAFATTLGAEPEDQMPQAASSRQAGEAAVLTDETGQTVRLVSQRHVDESPGIGYGSCTVLTAPLYQVKLPDGMFPSGFRWTFSEAGCDPAPEGAIDVLVVTDGATGETVLVVYCCRSDGSARTGTMPGYVQTGPSASLTDPAYSIMYAIPASLSNGQGGYSETVSSLQPVIHGSGAGSLGQVHGLDGENSTREAYVAYAVQEEGATRIVTPSFSLVIPSEYIGDGLKVQYGESVAADGTVLPGLVVFLSDVLSYETYFSVAVGYDVPESGHSNGATCASSVVTDDGRVAYATVSVSYHQNDDGSWYLPIEEAQAKADLYASWIEPAGEDAPAPIAEREVGDVVQTGSYAGGSASSSELEADDSGTDTGEGDAPGTTASLDAESLDNDLVSVIDTVEGTRLVTPRYSVDIPAWKLLGDLAWDYSSEARDPVPDGMQDVLVVRDDATDRVVFIAYTCQPDTAAHAFDPMDGYVQQELGRARSDGSIIMLAVPEYDAPGAAWSSQFRTEGSFDMIYGLEDADYCDTSAGETVLVRASQDAYFAQAAWEDGGLRIDTARYSVLIPRDDANLLFSISYRQNWQGTNQVDDDLAVVFSDGRYLDVVCSASPAPWDGENARYYTLVEGGAMTGDGKQVATSSFGESTPAEREAASEIYATWVTLR